MNILLLLDWTSLLRSSHHLKISMFRSRYGILQDKRDSRHWLNLSIKKLMVWSLHLMSLIQEVMKTLMNGLRPPTNMLTKKFQKSLSETSVISQTREKSNRNKPNKLQINMAANIMMSVLKWTLIFKNAWKIFSSSLPISNLEKLKLKRSQDNKALRSKNQTAHTKQQRRVADADHLLKYEI